MTVTHRFARSLLAPMFLTGGLDAVRNPNGKAKAAEKVAGQLSGVGLPDDPVQLVRINGAVQLAAGSLLLVGRAPRLASTVLAASLIPTTLAGHRFWEESDPVTKAKERTQFLKNVAMLGGLLLAALDTNGAPSLRWRARKSTGKALASVASMGASIGGHAAPGGALSQHVNALADSAAALGERAADAAAPLLERVMDFAGSVGETVGDRATHLGGAMSAKAASLGVGSR